MRNGEFMRTQIVSDEPTRLWFGYVTERKERKNEFPILFSRLIISIYLTWTPGIISWKPEFEDRQAMGDERQFHHNHQGAGRR
jgi:hypothetical protein